MKITGIDPSLTATGLGVIIDGRATGFETLKRRGKAPKTEEGRLDRLDDVVRSAHSWAFRSDLVVVEGLAFDGHDTRRQLAGLHWLLRHQLWDSGHRVAVVQPSSLRSFMGISARAPKSEVVKAAQEAFGAEVDDDNAADALWLAEVGAARLGCPVLATSPERLSLLRGVVWPTRDIAA